ncbi:MAG: phosphate ABC transporter substrate-binding protein [Thermoguttaceae bacterium]
MSVRWGLVAVGVGLWALMLSGCGSSDEGVRMEGSDTMVNVAQAWAETYHATHPEVMVQVSDGGSGVGIASLIDGKCDMANASRAMEAPEIERCKQRRGVEPKQCVIGYDALAVYVAKNNPLDSISMEELAQIYGKDGKITKWSQLGVDSKAVGNDQITLVGRHNSSGTYAYFQEAILGAHGEYKLGSVDESGSKEVVALVANTPGAIGYSGMGYATAEVKMLKLSRRKGEPGVAPTVKNAKLKSGGYPITRPLYIYTAGEPKGEVKKFLDWILGKQGQKVVLELGFVPVHDNE